MKILLCGYMGAGKSFWLENLAGDFARRIDLDAEIEKKWGEIPSIFSQRGEAYFRQVEREALDDVLARDGDILLALGGGTLNQELIAHLKSNGHGLVWIDTPLSICIERISFSTRPKASLTEAQHQELFNRRVALYRAADLRVEREDLEKIGSDKNLFAKLSLIMKGRIDEAHRHSS